MLKNLKFDYIFGILILVLIFLGILILASVSIIVSEEKFGKTTYYLFHQVILGILPGFIFAAIFFIIPLDFFKKWAWVFLAGALFLMIFVFIPGFGVVAGGAPRWLNLVFFTFQPSEFLKLAFSLYIAAWLANPIRKTNVKKYTLIPFFFILGIVALLLIKQSDLSTLFVIAVMAGAMYFSANTPLWHIGLMGLSIFLCGAVAIAASSYRMTRLKVMLGIIEDPMGLGYHIKQILITIGAGGIFGAGLGMSVQKFGFVPQTMSDSVFAIFSEETGFIGAISLIIIYLLVFWRSASIAKRTSDDFSRIFALGFGTWICLQAFVNMAAMTGIIPLTGIPLPFISYGGTHIAAELAGAGILLNISRNIKR